MSDATTEQVEPEESAEPAAPRRPGLVRRLAGRGARAIASRIEDALGGPARSRVVLVLGAVLALSSADTATVGASATVLRHALHIDNADIGLLVAVNAVVAAIASIPFGVLADRLRRTTTLGLSIVLWGGCMVWSATAHSFGGLLLTRLFLGIATASAGPVIASMLGDWFVSAERGRIYSYVLTGELLGGGVGFAVTGDVAALSWRLSFVILAIPAFLIAWAVLKLPEPVRGGGGAIPPGALQIPRVATAGYVMGEDAEDVAEVEEMEETDAQRVSREKGIAPDHGNVLVGDASLMKLGAATRYILSIRTNLVMIVAGACGYFYLAGIQTFGSELVHQQYGLNQALANLLILALGLGAVIGVLVGGRIGDALLRRGVINGRILVAAVTSGVAALAFIPALLTHHPMRALPYLVVAAFGLSAQNPPLDAARLDIMIPPLWGRAEGIRTFLRTAAQALAPVLFGAMSDIVFGNRHGALHWTFLVMLVPLLASSVVLLRAMSSYPRDVATAAAARGS
ncbi:MAG TPA: MFS transporter [Mycobacteriales bacterium]|nr:MFS transporter [Mycobacteriales bacterium]